MNQSFASTQASHSMGREGLRQTALEEGRDSSPEPQNKMLPSVLLSRPTPNPIPTLTSSPSSETLGFFSAVEDEGDGILDIDREVEFSEDDLVDYLLLDEDGGGLGMGPTRSKEILVVDDEDDDEHDEIISPLISRGIAGHSIHEVANEIDADDEQDVPLHVVPSTDNEDDEEYESGKKIHREYLGPLVNIPPDFDPSYFRQTNSIKNRAVSPFRRRPKHSHSADAALLVEDKPWRNKPGGTTFRRRNRDGTPTGGTTTALSSSTTTPRRILGYVRKLRGNKRADDGDVDTASALAPEEEILTEELPVSSIAESSTQVFPCERTTTNNEKLPEKHLEHDMIVEASSEDSSLGFDDSDEELIEYEDEDEFPWDHSVDWNAITSYQLPTYHILPAAGYHRRRSAFAVLNQETASMLTQREANHFVWHHGLFLQTVFQLLEERDRLGVEGSVDVTDNIWKKGPLKKLSTTVRQAPIKWKVKYVELRKGNFSYYEDSGQESGRKTIHLRAADTTVQEASSSSKSHGFVFEISQTGSPTRLWMAKSEEERQAWIRAIQSAIIGESVEISATRRDADLTPHQDEIDRYTSLRGKLKDFDLLQDYVAEVEAATLSGPIQLPVHWIRKEARDLGETDREHTKHSFWARGNPQREMKTSISDFWKSMESTNFALNGLAVQSDAPLAPQRIFGSLTRCILEFDNAFTQDSEIDYDPSNMISELQAVSYARDILLTVIKTKEKHDVLFAVSDLLNNKELVVLSPDESEEIIHLEVSFAGEDLHDDIPEADNEIAVWLKTRRKKPPTSWRRRYVIFSGVVFSIFEHASPRPRGLRGQMVLSHASTVAVYTDREQKDDEGGFVLIVSTAEEERLLSFDSAENMEEWKEAIQKAIDSCETPPPPDEADVKQAETKQRPNITIRKLTAPASRVIQGAKVPASRVIQGGAKGASRVIQGAKGGGIKVIRSAKDSGMKVLRHAVGRLRKSSESVDPSGHVTPLPRRPSMSMFMDLELVAGKREPTVQCVAQHFFKFIVSERSSSNLGEQLMTVNAKLFIAFLLSGGSNGRLSRGTTLIELDIIPHRNMEAIFNEESGSNFSLV